jgi:hypothetical protein
VEVRARGSQPHPIQIFTSHGATTFATTTLAMTTSNLLTFNSVDLIAMLR